jgi:hypothetical protein
MAVSNDRCCNCQFRWLVIPSDALCLREYILDYEIIAAYSFQVELFLFFFYCLQLRVSNS